MARPAKLTEQMERFCRAYVASGGNLTVAAERAGYKGTKKQLNLQGKRLLAKDQVQERIHALTDAPDVATVEELQVFWTKLVLGFPLPTPTPKGIVDMPPPLRDRLKASEYLGKTQGAFVERVQVEEVDTVFVLPDNGRGDKRPPPRGDDGAGD